MDWNAAIEKHSEALKRIIVTLFAMAGLCEPFFAHRAPPHDVALAEKPTLPRHLYRAILRLLRPAKFAARRLIIVAARSISVPQRPPAVMQAVPPGTRARPGTVYFFPQNGTASAGQGAGGKKVICPQHSPSRPLTLPLFDRLPLPSRPRRSAPPACRAFGCLATRALPHSGSAAAIAQRRDRCRAGHPPPARLAAVLDDLPRHARRFARWRANCDARLAAERAQRAAGPAPNPRAQTRRRRFYASGRCAAAGRPAPDALPPGR